MKNIINIFVTIGRVIMISIVLAVAPIIQGKKYDNEEDNEGDYKNDYNGDDHSVCYDENEYNVYQMK